MAPVIEYSSFYSQMVPYDEDHINNDLIHLEKAWIAEKGCNQLLPFKTETVSKIINAINNQVLLYLI